MYESYIKCVLDVVLHSCFVYTNGRNRLYHSGGTYRQCRRICKSTSQRSWIFDGLPMYCWNGDPCVIRLVGIELKQDEKYERCVHRGTLTDVVKGRPIDIGE